MSSQILSVSNQPDLFVLVTPLLFTNKQIMANKIYGVNIVYRLVSVM